MNRNRTRNSVHALVFLLPFCSVYFMFLILPLVQGLYISLHEWTKIRKIDFVGLENFFRMFQDTDFWESFGNTTLFVAISTPILLSTAFALALICNRPSHLQTFFRSAFFIPQVLSVSVICSLFMMMFRPYVGLINTLLDSLGLLQNEIFWFGKTVGLSWFFIILLTLYWTVGFSMLLFLAGLQDIPVSLYEAAEIDGAGKLYRIFHITIPILRPVTSVIFLLQVISSYKLFAQVWLTTRGRPGTLTRPMIQYIYQTGFIDNEMGFASAISYFLLVFLLLLALVINRLTRNESW